MIDEEYIKNHISVLEQSIYEMRASLSELKSSYVSIVNAQTNKLNRRIETFENETNELKHFAAYIMKFFNPDIKAQEEIARLTKLLDKEIQAHNKLKKSLKGLTNG